MLMLVAVGAVRCGAPQGRLGVHRVHTGHVQRHRVEGGEHSHVGHDGHVVLGTAVAVGGHIHHQGDVEAGAAIHHRLGVLGDFVVQVGSALVPVDLHGVLGTDGDTTAAAHAPVVVDVHLAVLDNGCAVGTYLAALAAADALLLRHMGLARVVLLHLTGAAAAAHADVLQTAAEARCLVSLEVGQGDEHIRVHDGAPDLGVLHILAAGHRHLHLVAALQAVGNNDLTAGGHGIEAIEHGTVHVVQRVLAAAHVQGVAVGQEGLAAPLLHEVRHRPRPVGTQERQVARLTKVQLDGHEFILEVDVAHTGGLHQAGQLLLQILMHVRPQVGKINLGCHKMPSLS